MEDFQPLLRSQLPVVESVGLGCFFVTRKFGDCALHLFSLSGAFENP